MFTVWIYEEIYQEGPDSWEYTLAIFLHKPSEEDLQKYCDYNLDKEQLEELLDEDCGKVEIRNTCNSLSLYSSEVIDNS